MLGLLAVRGMSFGHPKHCFLTVWTPKSLGQDLLMTEKLINIPADDDNF